MSEYNPMAELDLYRLLFRYFLEHDIPKRVSNNSTSHAIVLIGELIRSARTSVDVFCRCLSDEVWGQDDVIAEIRKAGRERHVRFRVVTQEKEIKSKARKELRLVDSEIRYYENDNIKANFMIVDGKSFRFENDCSNRKGFAYARNDKIVVELSKAFAEIFNKAQPVPDFQTKESEQMQEAEKQPEMTGK